MLVSDQRRERERDNEKETEGARLQERERERESMRKREEEPSFALLSKQKSRLLPLFFSGYPFPFKKLKR